MLLVDQFAARRLPQSMRRKGSNYRSSAQLVFDYLGDIAHSKHDVADRLALP